MAIDVWISKRKQMMFMEALERNEAYASINELNTQDDEAYASINRLSTQDDPDETYEHVYY